VNVSFATRLMKKSARHQEFGSGETQRDIKGYFWTQKGENEVQGIQRKKKQINRKGGRREYIMKGRWITKLGTVVDGSETK